MNYAGIIKNDIAAGKGICVTLFVQGCSFHCPGCHNPETWDYNGGQPYTAETTQEILTAINANGVRRNFCVMGGEPLSPQNYVTVAQIIKQVKLVYPDVFIYLWSGYTFEYLLNLSQSDGWIDMILEYTDVLIDGLYDETQRDITLSYRGSRNQRVIKVKATLEKGEIVCLDQ